MIHDGLMNVKKNEGLVALFSNHTDWTYSLWIKQMYTEFWLHRWYLQCLPLQRQLAGRLVSVLPWEVSFFFCCNSLSSVIYHELKVEIVYRNNRTKLLTFLTLWVPIDGMAFATKRNDGVYMYELLCYVFTLWCWSLHKINVLKFFVCRDLLDWLR